MTNTKSSKMVPFFRQHKFAFFVVFILVLCILGLSSIPIGNSCSSVSTRDVVVQFVGNNVAPSGVVKTLTYTTGSGDSAVLTTVAPVSYQGTNVYLVPNGVHYSLSWQANADGFGLATQSGVASGIAPCEGCTPITQTVCVHATVQDTPERT